MTPPALAPGRAARERTRTVPRRAIPPAPRRSAPIRPHRRVSGPISGRPHAVTLPRDTRALGARALAVVRGLPEHSLIDRLVRGRAWIPVLGVLLAGLVAMQVEILKLGTTIGRTMERSAALQSRNEALQATVATLADDQRIEKLAAAMGMLQPPPTSVVFLTAHRGSEVGRALTNIHVPDPSGFAAQLAAQAASAAAMTPVAANGPTTSATATSTTATSATATSATAASATAASTTAASTTAPQTTAAQTPAPTVAGGASGAAVTPSASPVAPAMGSAGVAPAATSQSGG